MSPAGLGWLTSPGSLCELKAEVSLKYRVDFLDPNRVFQKWSLEESHQIMCYKKSVCVCVCV